MRSLDPQVDNFSRQSRGTVQQWKGTAHLHATGALPKSFSMSKNVTTPLVAITALGLCHLLRPLASNRCPWALSLQPFRPRWPSLSSLYIYLSRLPKNKLISIHPCWPDSVWKGQGVQSSGWCRCILFPTGCFHVLLLRAWTLTF